MCRPLPACGRQFPSMDDNCVHRARLPAGNFRPWTAIACTEPAPDPAISIHGRELRHPWIRAASLVGRAGNEDRATPVRPRRRSSGRSRATRWPPVTGAFSTCTWRGARAYAKSSTSVPSRRSAWARTPAGAGTRPSSGGRAPARAGWPGTAPGTATGRTSAGAGAPVPPAQPPQARPAERSRPRRAGRRRATVALAGQRQHGVRAGVHAAVDHPGEVHAEERQRRVGHRVDQAADEVPAPPVSS